MTVSFVPDRFSSTVPFYRAHRLRYPDALVTDVARRLTLPEGGRVLDLGCGPGFLAIAFAARGHSVVGLDPDDAMLEGAREEAAVADVSVDFRRGSSYDLCSALGRFDLVTMGRSFHWMDRPATLRALDALVEPAGGVALFGDDHERTLENAWVPVMKATAQEFAGPNGFAHRRQGPDWVGHVAMLLDSAFPAVERTSVYGRRSLALDDIIGRALSMSGTAPDALGERRGLFEAALRERLGPLAGTDGGFTEVVECYAILARRAGSERA